VISEILDSDPDNRAALSLQRELDAKMAIIKWSGRYLVNIAIIDRQHQGLVEMINGLKKSLSAHDDPEVVKSILAEMETYAVEHFETEERLMLDTGFPLYAEHRVEHDYFRAELAKFRKYYQAGRALMTVHMCPFSAHGSRLICWALTENISGISSIRECVRRFRIVAMQLKV
jgi:hemerythrin